MQTQTGSFETLIGWKSGKTTYVPLWDRMEGAWLWTLVHMFSNMGDQDVGAEMWTPIRKSYSVGELMANPRLALFPEAKRKPVPFKYEFPTLTDRPAAFCIWWTLSQTQRRNLGTFSKSLLATLLAFSSQTPKLCLQVSRSPLAPAISCLMAPAVSVAGPLCRGCSSPAAQSAVFYLRAGTHLHQQ